MSMKRKAGTGPYAYDDDEDYVPTKGVVYKDDDKMHKTKVKKHTLDSDEEDEDGTEETKIQSGEILQNDDIDGQEESTLKFEGETTITPFNMAEEMEEGHFDKDGYYHFKKEDQHLKDPWLEDIDWLKVQQQREKYGSDVEDSDEEKDDDVAVQDIGHTANETAQTFKQMLEIMQPNETVAKALKRLGGGKKMSSAERWKAKKAAAKAGTTVESSSSSSNMTVFLKLTELANNIISTGDMDVYQYTYEVLTLKVKQTETPAEDEMDMFADEAAKDGEKKKGENGNSAKEDNSSTETKWEFKWENTDEAELHGPAGTEQMVKWQDSGYFDKGCYVRKAGSNNQWYSAKRVDFELYL